MTDAVIDRRPTGWHIRIPLHREEVTVRKEVVVVEEVDIRREPADITEERATVVTPTERLDSSET